jgi:hypothetical protein
MPWALLIAQHDIGELCEQLKALSTKNKRLQHELDALKKVSSTGSQPAPGSTITGIAADLEQVRTLAKCFTALYEPFSTIYNDPNLFTLPCPSSEALEPTKRFSTTKVARRDGWLAELYDFLPQRLHPMVRGHSGFDTEVRGVAASQFTC